MTFISDQLASIVVLSSWGLFVLVWSVSALFSKRTTYKQSQAESLRYKFPAVLAAIALLGGNRSLYPLDVTLIHNTSMTRWIVVTLSCAGLGLCLWARLMLGRNWSAAVTVKESHELVQRGPYRVVRHPIYTGLLIMMLGVAIIRGHVGAFLGVLLLFASFWIKSGYEERAMLQQFPKEYPAYVGRVKRIIPFVV